MRRVDRGWVVASPYAVVLSGAGRFTDAWHDFAATSSRVAGLLAEVGFRAVVEENVDVRLADLSGVDLVVLNIGNPRAAGGDGDAAARAGLLDHVGRGRAVLALHATATSLPAVPEWEAILGGIWVRGVTYHPEWGPARVQVTASGHPICRDVPDFDVMDERYTDLRVSPAVDVLAHHSLGDHAHPLVWTHRYGTAPVVYDALGHDVASYDSAAHRRLLGNAAQWLVGSAGDRGRPGRA